MSKFTSCDDCLELKHRVCIHEDCIHYPELRLEYFNPRPKQKVIKLDEMIGSDIDMEFMDFCGTSGTNSPLLSIENSQNRYCSEFNEYWPKCRIRQDHWHHWNGGECPLPDGLVIEIKTNRDIHNTYPMPKYTSAKNKKCWLWEDHVGYIIAFRVLGTADGWIHEWEEEKKND